MMHMKIVAFFNHKGGVGKTTLLFNVAIALGELGNRVAIIDADAQTNVTVLALEEASYQNALDRDSTIWSALSPLVSGAGDLRMVPAEQIREHVWLLPGDIRVSHFEGICPNGWTEALAGQHRGFRVTSALFRLITQFGRELAVDVSLVDLGSNVNALNRSALIAADGFVVPLAPDLFSVMALPSVGQSLQAWISQWHTACGNTPPELDVDLPVGGPTPFGYVTQQFSTYRKTPANAFKQWLERVPDAYEEGIIKPLAAAEVRIPTGEAYLGALKNFGALIPTAQEANKALFELSGREAYGAQFKAAQESKALFASMGTSILQKLGDRSAHGNIS
jgi:chromosome partitioning protein